jgi:hypothetical protein
VFVFVLDGDSRNILRRIFGGERRGDLGMIWVVRVRIEPGI